jgi:hypothetical protein
MRKHEINSVESFRQAIREQWRFDNYKGMMGDVFVPLNIPIDDDYMSPGIKRIFRGARRMTHNYVVYSLGNPIYWITGYGEKVLPNVEYPNETMNEHRALIREALKK